MKIKNFIFPTFLSLSLAITFTSCDKQEEPLTETVSTPAFPRSLTSANGKVYVSLFDGHVAQLDTLSYKVEKSTSVGANPEGIAVTNNRIYVANSGGLATINDSTISVIDATTFKEIKKIKVVINPVVVKADNQGDIYVLSYGNYGDIPYTLQRIEAATDKVTTISGVTAYNFTICGDFAYLYNCDWMGGNKSFSIYDVKNEKVEKSDFIASDAIEKIPFSIDVNPVTKDIYIGETDYKNTGKMYCFDPTGNLKFTFETGLNPYRTIFTPSNKGMYVMNQGGYKGNNAELNYYDLTTSTNYKDYFSTKNNRGLGDTGQDAILYGSKIYVALYNSSLIEVIDAKTGVSIKSIRMETVTTK